MISLKCKGASKKNAIYRQNLNPRQHQRLTLDSIQLTIQPFLILLVHFCLLVNNKNPNEYDDAPQTYDCQVLLNQTRHLDLLPTKLLKSGSLSKKYQMLSSVIFVVYCCNFSIISLVTFMISFFKCTLKHGTLLGKLEFTNCLTSLASASDCFSSLLHGQSIDLLL